MTKTGRMQCEGITNSGKRCLCFEPTRGARFCNTHALGRSTHGSGIVDQVTKCGTGRCEGITNYAGKQCLNYEERPGFRFCIHHAYQDASQKLGRICCGQWPGGDSCASFVPFPRSGPVLPPFCSKHANQIGYIRLERCQWSNEGRTPCFRYVSIDHTRYFCDTHMVHANSQRFSLRPITTVSDDILMTILDRLQPEERVAFALASKACAGLVRAWGRRDRPTTWASAATLEPIVVSKFSTAQSYYVLKGPRRSSHYVIHVVREARIASLPILSTFSMASLESLDTEHRRCAQPGKTPTSLDCSSRITLLMAPSAVAMALKHIPIGSVVCVMKKQFPYLFKLTRSCQCMFCGVDTKSAFLCQACTMGNKGLLVRWCTACHGSMRALHIARMFWQTQKPGQITTMENSVSS